MAKDGIETLKLILKLLKQFSKLNKAIHWITLTTSNKYERKFFVVCKRAIVVAEFNHIELGVKRNLLVVTGCSIMLVVSGTQYINFSSRFLWRIICIKIVLLSYTYIVSTT